MKPRSIASTHTPRPARPRPARPRRSEDRPLLITGAAGSVGSNSAWRLLDSGQCVLLFDNLSRPGVERNLRWLKETYGSRVEVEVADVRDARALARVVARVKQVFHFAAQVAVTTSLIDPIEDFEVNARGTLNLLEALRAHPEPRPLIYTSTNKVYGDFDDLALVRRETRYEPEDARVRTQGINESRPLDFHSPYGCSKGTADQYVADYARSFGLPTMVFRMSCIYGPHQFGTEDQGWVAHFLIRTIEGQPIVLYGDGLQVRDVLFVEDLVDALLLAQTHMDVLAGRAFNIGGGPTNTTSLVELVNLIGELHGEKPDVRFDAWRTGDQRYYVSDISQFRAATGWASLVQLQDGVERLYRWLLKSRGAKRAKVVVAQGAR